MNSGLLHYTLWCFCVHCPFPLNLLHASPKSKVIFKAVIAQAVLCEYMVLVIQSLHDEFGVFPSALLCPYLGEIWTLRSCCSLWDDILSAQDFVVGLCFLFPLALLKVFDFY